MKSIFLTLFLQTDIVQVFQEGDAKFTTIMKIVIQWINYALFLSLAIAIVMTFQGSGDGNQRNKKTGDWLWMLGFSGIGLYLVRKLFLKW